MSSESGEGTGQGPNRARRTIREQDALWAELLKLAASVESTLVTSIRALLEGRPELTAVVKIQEATIDRREVEIERECLRILALYDPTASDLRRMVTVLKVNRDLEDLADAAMDIARKAKKFAQDPRPLTIPDALKALLQESLSLIHNAFSALSHENTESALAHVEHARQLDRKGKALLREYKKQIHQNANDAKDSLRLMSVIRNVQRVAEHLQALAETLVYMKEGKIIRHSENGLS